MTDQTRLEEIHARVDAATPGPWGWWTDKGEPDYVQSYLFLRATEESGVDDYDASIISGASVMSVLVEDGNADFVAHSRLDIPYLLDLVAELTAERDALEGQLWQTDAAAKAYRAELASQRVILKEARVLHSLPAAVNSGLCHTCLNVRPCETFEVLSRGLEEDEE
jgi:hypothetical protein